MKRFVVWSLLGLVLAAGCSENLSNKPRAVTKSGYTATYTKSDFGKAWEAAALADAVVVADMTRKGYLIELPPGEEVIVLKQEGEFAELKFVNRTTHPDVWTHIDAVRISEENPVTQTAREAADIETSLRKLPQFVYVRTRCNIRNGPGTDYAIVRKATKGEELEYLSLEGDWYKLKVKGKVQEWIHKSVVIPSEKSKSQTPRSTQVINQITVNGEPVKVGDLADDVFKVLKQEDVQGQEIAKDPNNPASLVITKYCKVEGKAFALVFKRLKVPGPYRVEKIILGKSPPKQPAEGKTIKKLFYVDGHSEFSSIPIWSTFGGVSRGAYQVGMIRDGQRVEAIAVGAYKGVKFYKIKTQKKKTGWIDEMFLKEK